MARPRPEPGDQGFELRDVAWTRGAWADGAWAGGTAELLVIGDDAEVRLGGDAGGARGPGADGAGADGAVGVVAAGLDRFAWADRLLGPVRPATQRVAWVAAVLTGLAVLAAAVTPAQRPAQAGDLRAAQAQAQGGTAVRPPYPPIGPGPTLDGEVGRFPREVRLLVGGDRLAVLGGSGSLRAVPGIRLDRDEAVTRLAPVQGGGLAITFNFRLPELDRTRIYLVRTAGRDAILLDDADDVYVRAAGDVIVTRRWGPENTGSLTLLSPDGRTLARRSVSEHIEVAGLTRYGLVLMEGAVWEEPWPIRLVEPVSGRLIRVLGRAVPPAWAFDRHVVLTVGCAADPCELRVVDLGGGADRVFRFPPRTGWPAALAISPDARHLAVAFTREYRQDTPGTGFVYVADLADGTITRVPGVVGAALGPLALTWTPDSSMLVIGAHEPAARVFRPDRPDLPGKDRFAVWRLGEDRLWLLRGQLTERHTATPIAALPPGPPFDLLSPTPLE